MKKLFLSFAMLGFVISGFAQQTDSIKKSTIFLQEKTPITTMAEPLVVIDGNKQITRGLTGAKALSPNDIESINVLREESAFSKYGNAGLGGAIEIITKKSSDIPQSISNLKGDSTTQFSGIMGLSIRPPERAKTPLNTGSPSKRFLLLKDTDAKAQPIYIVDGKQVISFSNLAPHSISSISVLKKEAGAKKDSSGVIMITTKKDKSSEKKN